MDNRKIVDFFNSLAEKWDSEQVINENAVEKILAVSGIKQGTKVLDVACGTGVLFDYYTERNVSQITGIDISDEMVKRAREKFPCFEVVLGDAHEYPFKEKFDAVMIFNAFPHFHSPEKLFSNLYSAMNEGGRITVAHSMSRQQIHKCHESRPKAMEVSLPLPDEKELSAVMGRYFHVDTAVSDSQMYIVSGVKK